MLRSEDQTNRQLDLFCFRRRDEGSFEEVRNSKSHSSRYSDMATKMSASGTGPKLNLGNKYGPLSADQS